MIMAGRGRRLEDTSNDADKVGSPPISPESKTADLPSVTTKIKEIDTNDINLSLLTNIRSMFKHLFTSKEAMKDVISNLHNKALGDAEFGEKVVLALEPISHLEIDGALVRGELLSFIQSDFKAKETVAQSNKKMFLNSVLLLGNVYHRFRVCGEPIVILGIALLEYFDILLKGEEEELKILTKQVIINGTELSQVKNYEVFMQNLRTILVTKNLNSSSRCWILLIIDLMSNDLKPLKGAVRDFYVKNLGDEYTKLESIISVPNEPVLQSLVSPKSVKSQGNTSQGNKNLNFSSNKTDGFKKDLSKKFSGMSVKSGSLNKDKVQSSSGKSNRKDIWKSNGNGKGSTEHDDRCEKEENFYGIQKPRQSKPFSQKKTFNNVKISMKGNDDIKTDSNNLESQQETTEKNN